LIVLCLTVPYLWGTIAPRLLAPRRRRRAAPPSDYSI
jgi:hypothetical protein